MKSAVKPTVGKELIANSNGVDFLADLTSRLKNSISIGDIFESILCTIDIMIESNLLG